MLHLYFFGLFIVNEFRMLLEYFCLVLLHLDFFYLVCVSSIELFLLLLYMDISLGLGVIVVANMLVLHLLLRKSILFMVCLVHESVDVSWVPFLFF